MKRRKQHTQTYSSEDLHVEQRTLKKLALHLTPEQLNQLREGTLINCAYECKTRTQRLLSVANKAQLREGLFTTLTDRQYLEQIRQVPRDFVMIHNTGNISIQLQEETIEQAYEGRLFASNFYSFRGNIINASQGNILGPKGITLHECTVHYTEAKGIEEILGLVEQACSAGIHTPYDSLQQRLRKYRTQK